MSSNYVALIAHIGYADARRSWTSRLNSHNEMKNKQISEAHDFMKS